MWKMLNLFDVLFENVRRRVLGFRRPFSRRRHGNAHKVSPILDTSTQGTATTSSNEDQFNEVSVYDKTQMVTVQCS